MIRNQLLIIWRNALRNKTVTIVNISGLALSVTCLIFISLWIWDEARVNRFHKNIESIFAVASEQFANGRYGYGRNTVYPLGSVLKDYAPEIKEVVRVNAWQEKASVRISEKHSMERISYVDPAFLKVFSFPLMAGNIETALNDLYQVVITAEAAQKYFGNQDPVGRQLKISTGFIDQEITVSGVVMTPPQSSTIQFDFLMPIRLFEIYHPWVNNWGSAFMQTYVLADPIHQQTIEQKIANVPLQHHDWEYQLFLQSFGDVYLYSEIKEGRRAEGRIQYIWLFIVVGILIMLMGCVNFTNIFMASSTRRCKEVGLRKVMGAGRGRLLEQFLFESILMSLVALIIAVSLSQLLLPYFKQLAGKSLVMPFSSPMFILLSLALSILIGTIAGIYPALTLSGYSPSHYLNRQLLQNPKRQWLKKGIVIFQLFVSIALIIATSIVYDQLNFIRSKHLGMDKEDVIYIPLHERIPYQHLSAFENTVATVAGIESFTFTGENPLTIYNSSGDLNWAGKDPTTHQNVFFTDVGYDFLKTLDIELVEGRTFSRSIGTDTVNFMVNEEAAKMIGEDALNTKLSFWGREGRLIGIFKDFHHKSLHSSIGPLMLRLLPWETQYLMVKASPANLRDVLSHLETAYLQFEPEYPFEYYVLNDQYQSAYNTDRVVGRFSTLFSIIAILISCLGLYGLISLTVEQKTKEIGIRKTLGASVQSILIYLSSSYVRWVFIATAMAVPIMWYYGNLWLENFAYHTRIGPGIFITASLVVLVITALTLLTKAFNAAKVNPVEALRYE